MVGYVLLIVIAVSLGILVYGFLKIYVPPSQGSCSIDVSLSIEEARCADGKVEVLLMNRGLFNIDGAYIRIGDPNRIVKTLLNGDNIRFTDYVSEEGLPPGELWPKTQTPAIYSYAGQGSRILEIEPVVYIGDELILCDQAVITQIVFCSGESSEIIEISITEPLGSYTEGEEIPLSFSILGNNINSCWYTLDGGLTNSSISGCDSSSQINTNIGTLNSGSYSIQVYVDDVGGNIASDSSNFDVNPAQNQVIITITNPANNGIYEYLNGLLSIPISYNVQNADQCAAKVVDENRIRIGPLLTQCTFNGALTQNQANFPRDGTYYLNVSGQNTLGSDYRLRPFQVLISPAVEITSPPPVVGCDADFSYVPTRRKFTLDFCLAQIFHNNIMTGENRFEDCTQTQDSLSNLNSGNYRIDLYVNDTGNPVNTGFDSTSFTIGPGCTGGDNHGGWGGSGIT